MHMGSGCSPAIRSVNSDAENTCLNKHNTVPTCRTGRMEMRRPSRPYKVIKA